MWRRRRFHRPEIGLFGDLAKGFQITLRPRSGFRRQETRGPIAKSGRRCFMMAEDSNHAVRRPALLDFPDLDHIGKRERQ
ncbi:hypothetical protein BVK87_00155 [Achromobacter denitrificans]|nr:hypothetical protein BVK87_00155 [Achromobacter denitrificans]